jgi:hypothetical protein
MIKFYNYIYYNLHRWAAGLEYDKSPEYTAFFSISFLTICNILTVMALIRVIIGHPISIIKLSKIEISTILLILTIPQWFYLIYKNRFERIINSFENRNKIRDTLITWTYIILSLGLLFLSTYFMMRQNISSIN